MSDRELIDEVATGAANRPEVESIWLTKPSIKPIVLAASFALILIGLFGFRPLMYVAIAVAIATALSWMFDARRESDELPLS